LFRAHAIFASVVRAFTSACARGLDVQQSASVNGFESKPTRRRESHDSHLVRTSTRGSARRTTRRCLDAGVGFLRHRRCVASRRDVAFVAASPASLYLCVKPSGVSRRQK
jgi:hypothetical protein